MNRIQNAHRLTVPIAVAALLLVFTARGQGPRHHNNYMASSLYRVDTLNLRAKGLRPNSFFTVFLTGSKNYIGELETNEEGRAALRMDALSDAGQNLEHTVLRLTNPVVDDVCFTPAHEGEIPSGRTPSITTIVTGESVSTGTSLFHSIHWRFIKCVSTF